MVPCALYEDRSNVTIGIEPETCITILVVTPRAGSDTVAGAAFVGMVCGYPNQVPAIENSTRQCTLREPAV